MFQVEGYSVQCNWSSDGTLLATGSSTGSVHFYEFQSTRSLLTLHAHKQACMCVSYHPVIPAVVATCDWGGEIKIWNWQPQGLPFDIEMYAKTLYLKTS